MPQHDEDTEFVTETGCLYFVDDASEYDYSDMETSSAETRSTMSTLESMEVPSYFRELGGRMFPADTNVPLLVPTDDAEVKRLEMHHLLIKLVLEQNYLDLMRGVLKAEHRAGCKNRVLDLVTLEGTWVQEVSREFPEVDFVSIDSLPLRPHQPCPNVTFEVYDLYNGIAEPDESFDVVHIRYAVVFIKNFKPLIREVHRVLRPGGLILFCEYEFEVYDALYPDVPAWGALPGIANALRIVRSGLAAQGAYVYAWRDLQHWLPCDSSFWKENELESDDYFSDDTGDEDDGGIARRSRSLSAPGMSHYLSTSTPQRGFVGVHPQANLVPLAPWSDDPRQCKIGAMVQEVWSEMWQNMGSSLRMQGLSLQEAEETVRAALHDIWYPSVRACAKLHTLSAFKADGT